MTTEDLNHCHWLKLLSLVHCCTPFHLCDWVMRYHRLYAPKYSCENKSGKWRELFSHSPGLIMGGWGEMTTKHPGRHHTQDAQGHVPPYLNRTRRCRAENGCTGNGFNIKPSGKSWGKAEPVLKNIYVSFVMDASLAYEEILYISTFFIIYTRSCII